MANIGSLLKDEITRLARKELKATLDPLRKANAAYRRDIAALKRQVGALERGRTQVEKQLGRVAKSAVGEAVGREQSSVRFSAKAIKAQRAFLGLSAEEFGRLAGISGQSIYNYEKGSTTPRQEQARALAALRGLGKREARARLDAQQ